jgi:hypothetical protein
MQNEFIGQAIAFDVPACICMVMKAAGSQEQRKSINILSAW